MSRVVTPPTSNPGTQVKVPHEKIAMRAYEKWCKHGCQNGRSVQDWLEAENELRCEFSGGQSQTQTRR